MLYYGLLVYFMIRKEMSRRNILFCLLYLICRTHNCVIIVIHMIFYEYLLVNDASLAFLLSQSAFFHLVRIFIKKKNLFKIVFVYFLKGKFEFICNNWYFNRFCRYSNLYSSHSRISHLSFDIWFINTLVNEIISWTTNDLFIPNNID